MLQTLHNSIASVCPIDGISIGAFNDKSTWVVHFKAVATDQQKSAATAIIQAFDPHAPTFVEVNAERDRRLAKFPFGGKLYDFCDGRGSDINIAGAGTLALAAIMAGAQANDLRWADPAVDFSWVAADNSIVTMDAQTCLNFAKAAADWKAKHIRKARAMKDMNPIPADYASDSRWTS